MQFITFLSDKFFTLMSLSLSLYIYVYTYIYIYTFKKVKFIRFLIKIFVNFLINDVNFP